MLKHIHPLLFPELLKVLAEMGHGDEIVLADANFTAHTLATRRPVLHWPGVSMAQACEAVLSVLPLDEAVAQPVAYMQVGGSEPGYRSALQRQIIDAMAARGDARPEQCLATERFAFYDRAREAFAVVQTGELQPWANFVLKKGVIAHPLET